MRNAGMPRSSGGDAFYYQSARVLIVSSAFFARPSRGKI